MNSSAIIFPKKTQKRYKIEEAELLTALYKRLQKLDPDGRRMCELIMQGKSERETAEDMQMARSTFKRHWNIVKELLREQLKDYR